MLYVKLKLFRNCIEGNTRPQWRNNPRWQTDRLVTATPLSAIQMDIIPSYHKMIKIHLPASQPHCGHAHVPRPIAFDSILHNYAGVKRQTLHHSPLLSFVVCWKRADGGTFPMWDNLILLYADWMQGKQGKCRAEELFYPSRITRGKSESIDVKTSRVTCMAN